MINQRARAVQLSVFLTAFFIVWSIRATIGYRVDESIVSQGARAAFSDLLKLVIWVAPAVVFVSMLRRDSPARYLGITVWPSRSDWLKCSGVTVAFLVLVTLVEAAFGRKSLSATRVSSLPVSLWLLQLVISPFLEEVLFRGFVMTELLAIWPRHRAMAITSLLFTAIHFPFWLSHGGINPGMFVNSIGVFVFSLVACWLLAKTGSIWPPTLAHILNNVVSSMWG
jgi:membrane protease YdiL (CAAX protease family)